MSDETTRREQLEQAGNNPFRLPPHAIPYDYWSDVPEVLASPPVHIDPEHPSPDDVVSALAPLCGHAHLALLTKGRSAELALVEALAVGPAPVVLTHGLFSTTQTALARVGAVLEDLPIVADGSADVDLAHLGARLERGGVRIVYLELANNGLFGWPVSERNLGAVRELCERHRVLLLVDATRSLTNAAALGAPDIVGVARKLLALSHAFTISCAKELLAPTGAIVGSADAELIGRVAQIAFRNGTSLSPIEPPALVAELRDGTRYSLAHPELVTARLARARTLADHLVRLGVPVVQPVTAHALYVPLGESTVAKGDICATMSVLGHLYTVAGIRGLIVHTRRGPTLRIAFQLVPSSTAPDLGAIGDGIAAFMRRLGERTALRLADDPPTVIPYFRRMIRA